MKKFFEDYTGLCKETGKFYKNHWKGCVVMNAAILGVEAGWIFRKQIKNKINEVVESKKTK